MKKNKHKILTAGILFTAAAGVIHIVNHTIFTTATLKDLLKSSANNYYDWRFGKIYYKKKGHGSPLLLVHDLTVYSSAYEWNKVIDKLAENHTVYALDLLGCGRSEKPKSHIQTIYMYSLYQTLSRMSFMKKQMLLPADFQVLLLYLHATMRMSFLEN